MTDSVLTPEPGIYPNVPAYLYHAWDAVSNSRLSRLRQSPAHLQAYLSEPKQDTAAMKIGRAVHTSILEPEEFDAQFIVAPTCEKTVEKTGKPCTNNGVAINGDGLWVCGVHGRGITMDDSRAVISLPMMAQCLAMRASIHTRVTGRGLLEGPGHYELSIVWRDKETGLLCKARFDRYAADVDKGTIADVKTTEDATLSAFMKSIYTYGYHRQGAFYLDGGAEVGLPAAHYAILAVEKSNPYASATYRLTSGAIDAGRDQLRRSLALYARCKEMNVWPAYPDEVIDITLPDYAWKQIDEELK